MQILPAAFMKYIYEATVYGKECSISPSAQVESDWGVGGGLTMTDRGNTVTCCYFSFTGKCFESKQAFSVSQSSA